MVPDPRVLRLRAALAREHGMALPMAMLVVLILAALLAALAQTTTSEFGIAQSASQDTRALYLAQAGIEHQIYALKQNKDAGSVGAVNYPVTAGQEYWYSTALTCLLGCGVNGGSRRWQIVSTGEIRQANSATVLQTRAVRTLIEIHYAGSGASLFQFPTQVLTLRWEEVYP